MRRTWVLVFSCFVLLMADSSARALDPPPEEAKKYKATIHTPEGEKEQTFDMHQPGKGEELNELLAAGHVVELKKEKPINILEISWDLGLWTAVVFVLLLFTLRRLAWKPMLEGLNKREQRIHNDIDQARQEREQAEKLRQQFEAHIAQSEERARGIIDEGRRDAQRLADDIIAKAKTEMQSEKDRLYRELQLASDQALQQLWNQAADMATLISTKAIRRQLTPDDHKRLMDEALTELGNAAGKKKQMQSAL
jgi:F-type H+-transporting ATPase subunit b